MLDDDTESALARLRAGVRPVTFRDGFADRVAARRLAPSPTDAMQRVFLRLTPLALAATLVLAAMNLFSTRASELSFMDRLLGVPAPSDVAGTVVDDDLSAWGVGSS